MLVEELIEPHGPRLWRLCRHLARCTEDAEELYQQTFLRALENEKRIDRDGNPGAWLCATAAGLWKSSLRRTARREAIAPTASEEDAEQASGGETPEDVFLKRERMARVNGLVDALPEQYREPLILFYSGELTVEEIAKALRIPKGTVKSRLFRAREQMKAGWEAQEREG